MQYCDTDTELCNILVLQYAYVMLTSMLLQCPTTHCRDAFHCFHISKVIFCFLHISSELKLILAVKMSPQWKSDLISPLWQVSWCTWFIVFNLHSQVAYQAADRQREMETPHISSADCASHFATCLPFKEACHELHRVGLNPCSLRRHFWNKEALRGLACQPVHPPMFLLFPAWSLYSIFPACSKVVFYHLS